VTQQAHAAAHRYLASVGFPMNGGNAARVRWAALSLRQQQYHIIRSLRAAGVSNSFIRANIGSIMSGATPGRLTPRPSGFPGGILVPVFAQAVCEVLINPSVAQAAEIDRSWRGFHPDTIGRAEWGYHIVVNDRPHAWNLLGEVRQVSNMPAPPLSWTDLGEVTVGDVRDLDGIIEERHVGRAAVFLAGEAPFGYWREVTFLSVIRFTRQ
jgi:hypothetical protein